MNLNKYTEKAQEAIVAAQEMANAHHNTQIETSILSKPCLSSKEE
jgi:hypothetical protein